MHITSAQIHTISTIKKLIEIKTTINDHHTQCLLDSGATNNFISYDNAQTFGLSMLQSDQIPVRLADGQQVFTRGYCVASLKLGQLTVQQRFEVLQEKVATILGMPFLETCNPHVNWKTKTLKIKQKGRLFDIPTVLDRATSKAQQNVSQNVPVVSKNSFQELDDVSFGSQQLVDVDGEVVGDQSDSLDQNLPASTTPTPIVSKPVGSSTRRKRDSSNKSTADSRVLFNKALDTCTTLQQMLQLCATFDDKHPSTSHTIHAAEVQTPPARSKIEHVSLHAFVRGMKTHSYRQSFVMIGQDIVNDADMQMNSLSAAQISQIDTSQVSQSAVEACNLVGGLNTAIAALYETAKLGKSVKQLHCPHCRFPHLDTSSTCHSASSLHTCQNRACQKQYKHSSDTFGNPLAAYEITSQGDSHKLEQKKQAALQFTHRTAYGEKGQSDVTTLSDLATHTMQDLKRNFGEVFSEPTFPIDRPRHRQHHIKLKDPTAPPPKRRLYPLAQDELMELKEQIELFLSSNRIRPSDSPYGAPILFARKKDGRLRMCTDYRALNSQTVPDSFPLPRIDELLARIQGAKYFSKLDLRDGYHQIPVAEDSRPLTAFTCRYGTFEWLVMPFGLTNAPGTFQRVMNDTFFTLLDKGVLVYLDDILIYTKTKEEHVALLKEVFTLLQQNQLYIKESKCALFLEHVEFLGHVISAQGVSVESGKTDAIKNWPVPTSVNEVQQFMGLANYYRKFIFKFSEIAQPITQLTRKNVIFAWTDSQQKAFETLKRLLCSAPVLKVFDDSLSTRIICDASDFAIGSVLEQLHVDDNQWHPVEFMSKSLNSAERNYSATDREFVAVRYSLEKWQHLLANREFLIYTDHAALTYLQSSSHISRRNARWLEFLSQFRFEMLHIRGDSNVADHLSRITRVNAADVAQLRSFISVFDKSAIFEAIKQAQATCVEPWYTKLVEKARAQANQHTSQQIQQPNTNDVLQYRNNMLCILRNDYFCPVVPRDAGITHQILRDLHASSLGGHLGFYKLYKLVQKRFYWHNMRSDIDLFCKQCVTCQQHKVSTKRPAGLLQPLPVPTTCFESISMDFVTHLPLSDGYDAIFSIVDRFSKYCKFLPIRSDYDAPKIAQLLFDHWICVFGMPRTIVSDRDAKFTSAFWQCLMKLLACKTAMSSAYHPQTDGQTERFHRTIEQVVRCFCGDNQGDWVQVLQQCSFALNSSVHQVTQQSPFYTVFLREPHLPLDAAFADVASAPVEAAAQLVRRRASTDDAVRRHITKANAYARNYANRSRRDLCFAPGDHVMLSTQNLPLPKSLSRKLAPRWLGPLTVLERIGAVAYRVALPENLSRLHPVFHVGLLKPFVGAPPPPHEPVFRTDGEEEYEVERITSHRVTRGRKHFLVVWKGYPVWEASWVPEGNLEHAKELLEEYKASHGLG